MNKGNCCVGEEDIVVYKIPTSWLSFLICVGPVKHMHMYMHTCAVYHFDCHFIAVTTVNSIVYTQTDNARVHVLLYSVHAPTRTQPSICFSVHVRTMLTMATSSERC